MRPGPIFYTDKASTKRQQMGPWRSTMGLALGVRGGMASSIVVMSWKREDITRELYAVYEWEDASLNLDRIAAALKFARETYHPLITVGYHGGREDEKVFETLSIRLGQYVQQMPGDQVVPTKTMAADFECGRLKVPEGGLCARDLPNVIWRDGVPGQTGPIASLRCAYWGALQWRIKKAMPRKSPEMEAVERRSEARRRVARPY
jgi:hypothetical protein